MTTTNIALAATLLALAAPRLTPGAASTEPSAQAPEWNARYAEHLLNRAGFGGDQGEVERLVALGREGAVDELLRGADGTGTPVYEPWPTLRPGLVTPDAFADEPLEPGEVHTRWVPYAREMGEYIHAWIDAMVGGDDPLRDRMTIFWHNHFVSSFDQVGDAHEMVLQIAFLRAHGLGDFRVLVDGMSRDPAMLQYLNNNLNVAAHPNENWARELMELFTLGEGNYTEDDIKEAARAFTGWTDRDYRFFVDRVQHDFGAKTVLGVTGNLDGDLVADILMEQEACAEWLAWKLLNYFEGAEPSEERLTAYAQVLRDADYDLGAFLRHLFLDDAFYRDEIVGNRVSSPIGYLVGATRRLGADTPSQMIFAGADLLGQRLCYPPSVKGWEGGMTWLPTAAVLNRSNLVGAVLGLVDLAWLKVGGDGSTGDRIDYKTLKPLDPMRMLIGIQAAGWKPDLTSLAQGLTGDADADAAVLVERLLAREPDPGLVERVSDLLAGEMMNAMSATEQPYESAEAKAGLARAAHVILSLPEAMLD